jgi:gamma-glutamyltranspeptidase / glutathione hydrolase
LNKNLYCLLILVFFLPTLSLAEVSSPSSTLSERQPAAIFDRSARFHPVTSSAGMVVSQEVIASRVGAEILSKGGNAIDAAVATGFALAVTLPQAGNLGGGGFMLVYLANSQKTVAIDYREMAPALADKALFIDEKGRVDTNLARFSHRSAGVPGTVAGLIHVLEQYGSMSLQQVIEPAILLAEGGFDVSSPLAYSLNRAEPRLKSDIASAQYFFREDGKILQAGDHWLQPDLANTLKKIAEKGTDGFYRGSVADLIVAEMKRGDGIITHNDLANYKVIEREPIFGRYHGYTVASMPPPSSGGIHLVQMLNILEGWDLASHGHNSADYLHRLIETMRRAYADRSQYLGDPDFYPVPVKALTDKAYAKQLRQEIDLQQASLSTKIKPGLPVPKESPQTTHFSVWDSQGNVVSNTYTLNFSYGSGIAVEGAGFLLNNEMDDFSAKPGIPNAYGLVGGKANAIEPHKRPLSSMTPTIIFKGGDSGLHPTMYPIMATGSPGGSTIITVVLQNILNRLEFGMNIAEATAAPRIHHQWLPDEVYVEPGINPDTIKILQKMGHQIKSSTRVMGRVQAITGGKGGQLSGMTDPRWPGGEASPGSLKPNDIKKASDLKSHH